jgi:hypothetical protein
MNYGTRLTLEDKISTLFQVDPVLPALYQETFRRTLHLPPEQTLMLAVLEDAVMCFQRYAGARDGKTRQLFRDAEEWILEQNSRWFFSFEHICGSLGFEPGYIRQGLIRERDKPAAPAVTDKHRPTDGTDKKKGKRRSVQLAA